MYTTLAQHIVGESKGVLIHCTTKEAMALRVILGSLTCQDSATQMMTGGMYNSIREAVNANTGGQAFVTTPTLINNFATACQHAAHTIGEST